MNISEIEALLDKYYEGASTISEEKVLRDFFRRLDVPIHLRGDQKMFVSFVEEQGQSIRSTEFDSELTKRLSQESAEPEIIAVKPNRIRFLFVTSIAATVLLLIGLFFTYRYDVFRKEKPMQFTSNQEMAYAEANEVLMIVSSNLNAGLRHVERLQMVDKAMDNLQLFNRFYQYQTIIINPDELPHKSINSK